MMRRMPLPAKSCSCGARRPGGTAQNPPGADSVRECSAGITGQAMDTSWRQARMEGQRDSFFLTRYVLTTALILKDRRQMQPLLAKCSAATPRVTRVIGKVTKMSRPTTQATPELSILQF